MDDINKQLLDLLDDKLTFTDLVSNTGLTSKQITDRLNYLKYKGYLIDRIYYENKVYYQLSKHLLESDNQLVINHNSSNFRFIAVADTHFGSNIDCVGGIEKIYDYAKEHNIHNIFHLGDLIEGIKYKDNIRIKDTMTQVEYVIENYPYDNSISNYVLLGNHDIYSILNEGFDISKILFDSRYDFVNLGYKDALIKILNYPLLLLHTQKDDSKICEYLKKCRDLHFVLEGHFHNFEVTTIKDGILKVKVPTLSGDSRFCYSGALDITITNFFQEVVIIPLVVDKSKIIQIGEICQKVLLK